jgi:hypothetical protein
VKIRGALNTKEHEYNSISRTAKYGVWCTNFHDIGNYFLGTGMNGDFKKSRFILFDKKMDITGIYDNYPVFSNNDNENEALNKEIFNISWYRISPNRKRMVFASYNSGLMEIFNLESLPDSIPKIKSLLLTPITNGSEIIWGFEDIYASDKYIYTLHNGKTISENTLFAKTVKIFNWDGEPVAELRAGINMRCLAVDEKCRKIYAVAIEEDSEFFLITMDMPEI